MCTRTAKEGERRNKTGEAAEAQTHPTLQGTMLTLLSSDRKQSCFYTRDQLTTVDHNLAEDNKNKTEIPVN